MSEKYEGMWDWSGACDPSRWQTRSVRMHTFSVGCFQWLKKASRNGFKKGRVQYRIKGDTDNPQEVYDAAATYCAKKNAAA